MFTFEILAHDYSSQIVNKDTILEQEDAVLAGSTYGRSSIKNIFNSLQ